MNTENKTTEAKSTDEPSLPNINKLAEEYALYLIPEDWNGEAETTTWEDVRRRFAKVFIKGYKAALNSNKLKWVKASENPKREGDYFVRDHKKAKEIAYYEPDNGWTVGSIAINTKNFEWLDESETTIKQLKP